MALVAAVAEVAGDAESPPRLAFDGAVAEEELGQLEALGVAAPGAEAKRCLEVASALPTARHPASSTVLNHFQRQGKT
jgi:hypothetical protein